MTRYYFHLLATFFTVIAFIDLTGCARRSTPSDSEIIATWGDTAMTVAQFKDWMYVRHRNESSARKEPYKERYNIIYEYILRDCKLLEGKRLGFAEREDIRKEYESAVERRATDLLYNDEIRDRLFTEQMLQNWLEHDMEEVRCRHLLIEIPAGTALRDTMQYWEKINEIYQKAKGGENFTSLVSRYSQDKSIDAKAQGDLGFFRWGRMVDEFQEAAWKLKPGEISPPVRTRYGYHLIQMIERRPTNVEYNTWCALVKVNRKDTPAETTIAYERAKSILAEAKKPGADLTQIARKYSEDENTWVNGEVGWVSKGSMPSEYWEACYRIKEGEFAGPVRTYRGYYVIKYLEKRTNERSLKDKNVREDVMSAMSHIYRDTLKVIADRYMDEVKRAAGMRYDMNVVNLILHKLSDKSAPTNVNLFSSFTPEERELLVVHDKHNGVKLQQLVDMFGDHRFPPNFRNEPEFIYELVNPLVTPKYLAEYAKAKGYYERPEVLEDGRRSLDNAILPEIEKEMVYNKAVPTEADMKKYFETNKSKYTQAATASVIEVRVEDKQLADDLLGRIKKGEDISNLARRYTTRENAKGKGGRIGPFKRDDYGPVSRRAFEMKVGDVAGPIQDNKSLSIVKLVELTPEKVQAYDEVRSQIESDVRFDMQTKIKNAWEEEIKKAYHLTINEKMLREVWPLLEDMPEGTNKERREWKEQRRQAALRKASEDQIKLKLKPGSEQEYTTKDGKRVQVKIGEPRYVDKEGKEIDPGKSKVKLTPKGRLEVNQPDASSEKPVIKLKPKEKKETQPEKK
ncbi:MAG: hypothetical protein FJY65_04935 [Calditrichaeota bacterium]|nr:hypothetical protein [Calditrichota bacterium]